MKTIGGIGRMKYRGRERVAWTFTLAAAAYLAASAALGKPVEGVDETLRRRQALDRPRKPRPVSRPAEPN
jgi:hypothetical protein